MKAQSDSDNEVLPKKADENSNGNNLRIIFGIIVIGIIILNIWFAISKHKSSINSNANAVTPITEEEVYVTEVVEAPVDGYYYDDEPAPSAARNSTQSTNNTDISSANYDLIYRVDGCTDPEYYWTVRVINGMNVFQYIIADPYTGEQSIARSGKWHIQTFGELKAEHPAVRLRNRSIDPSKKIIIVGPVDTFGDRNVEGIIVPNGKYADIYLNDDDDPMEFFLFDHLIRQ